MPASGRDARQKEEKEEKESKGLTLKLISIVVHADRVMMEYIQPNPTSQVDTRVEEQITWEAIDKRGGITCSSSFPPPLFSTSISRQRLRKSLKMGDSFSGFCSSGVPLVAIRYSALGRRGESAEGKTRTVRYLTNVLEMSACYIHVSLVSL